MGQMTNLLSGENFKSEAAIVGGQEASGVWIVCAPWGDLSALMTGQMWSGSSGLLFGGAI